MADYISREDAKVFVRHACYKKINPIDYLDEIPAADVRPVVRGRWEIASDPRFRHCSVCHDKVVFNMKNYPNFCDVCGADMRPNLDTTKGDNHD